MLHAYNHMTQRPIHFKPDSNHLAKWIEPNRFQTALAQCAFSVNANRCALNRIECALSVQCERAFSYLVTCMLIQKYYCANLMHSPIISTSLIAGRLCLYCIASKNSASPIFRHPPQKKTQLSLIYGKGNPNNYNIASLNIAHFRHLHVVHVAREKFEMEKVIAVDAPTPKRRRLTDYFAKFPSNTETQEFPQCLMSTLVQDNKRFSDAWLSHNPVDVVALYSCLNKKGRHVACSRARYSATD